MQYQLIYHPAKQMVIGAEALCDGIAAAEGSFSPIALYRLLRDRFNCRYWVLDYSASLQGLASFKMAYGPEFKISVNISRVQLNEEDFVDQVLKIMGKKRWLLIP